MTDCQDGLCGLKSFILIFMCALDFASTSSEVSCAETRDGTEHSNIKKSAEYRIAKSYSIIRLVDWLNGVLRRF